MDIGSSSVRGALFDASGRMLAKTLVRNERRLTATRDGGAELDADKAFRQVTATIDEVLQRSENAKGEIVSIASCSFWHGLMGIAEGDNPTTPVFGWADNRSRKYVDAFRKRFDETVVHNRTGARFHSSFWPAKLLWLKKNSPDVWERTARWISFGDYVSLKLTGEILTSISMASGTGIFDIRTCEWDAELLRYLKLKRSALPEVADDELALTLLPKWRKRWPRLTGAKWFPTIADGVANNIGSGCVGEGRAALMVGTSGAMRVLYKGEPPTKIPNGLWCYRVDRGRVIVGGALSDGGGLYDWLTRNLRIDMSDAAIGKEMARRGADAHGLTFMPFLAGERSTGYNENAIGSILVLTMAHDSIDLLQAGMESVAFRFAEISDQLKSIFPDLTTVASGGALAASLVWKQIIADVLGCDIGLSSIHEASLHGAVLLALANTGKIELSDRSKESEILSISFHPECHSIYSAARSRHQEIYEMLKPHNS